MLLGYPPDLPSLVFFVRNVGDINSTVFNDTNLSSVTSLTMTQSGITSIAPGALAQFHNLKVLNLRNNDLSKMTSDWFIHKEVLQSLNLSNNSITTLNENSFAGLVGLLNLNLKQNQIQTITPGSFRFLNNLGQLDLSYNKLRRLSVRTLNVLNNTKLFLHGNPWDCSCSVYEFSQYLRGKWFLITTFNLFLHSKLPARFLKNARTWFCPCSWLVSLRKGTCAAVKLRQCRQTHSLSLCHQICVGLKLIKLVHTWK